MLMDWNGKKVLVTGACGFIGSHLVEALVKQGASVRAYVLYNSFNSWGWLEALPAAVKSNCEVVAGDIRDPLSVAEAVQGVDMVFHLAALIAIPYSYAAPSSYVQTNVAGTLNVVQACRQHGVERVMHTSTSEVYGTAQYVPIDEKHPQHGQSPYSASKIGADKIAESYYRSFDVPVVTVRPFNTYGPRQSARAFIPTIITQLMADKRQIKIGSLEPTRDLTFVKDTARGFMEIAAAENVVGEEIHIATQSEVAMGEVARMIMTLMHADVEFITDAQRVRPEKSEVYRLFGSNQKLKQLTGWQPESTLQDGLQATIDWFRENCNRYKPDEYNV
jgi:NAD dependent epimerase/dehydratase